MYRLQLELYMNKNLNYFRGRLDYITNNLKIGVGIGYSSFNSGDETEAGTVSGLTFSPRISYAIGKFDA